MLDLENAVVIGKGSSRICYLHPYEKNKCIKINYSDNPGITSKELSHYRRHENRKISWEMVAVSYGTVETSMGKGVVFSLARDFNGNISRTLDYYLRMEAVPFEFDNLAVALKRFKRYLRTERIPVREIKADNLVYQRVSESFGKVIIIDGLGNNEFLPLANYSHIFANRMLLKKWRKFRDSLLQQYPDNSLAKHLLARL